MVGSVPCGRMWGGAGGNGEVIGGGLCAWAVKTARGVPGGEWAARLWVRRSEWACGALCEALGAVQEQSWSRRVPWKARNRPVERRKAAAGVCPKEPKTAVRGFPRRWGPFRSGVGVGERWEAGNRPVERRKAAAGGSVARKSRKRLYGAFRGAGGRSGAELESESVGRRGIGL